MVTFHRKKMRNPVNRAVVKRVGFLEGDVIGFLSTEVSHLSRTETKNVKPFWINDSVEKILNQVSINGFNTQKKGKAKKVHPCLNLKTSNLNQNIQVVNIYEIREVVIFFQVKIIHLFSVYFNLLSKNIHAMSVFWVVKNAILAHKVDHLVVRFFTVKEGKIVGDFMREVSFKVMVKMNFKIFIEVNVVLVGFNRLSIV